MATAPFNGTYPAPDTTAPTAPGMPVITNALENGTVTVTVAASADAVGVIGYAAFLDGSVNEVGRSNTTVISLSGIPAGAHNISVRAFDARGNYSAGSSAGFSMPVKAYKVSGNSNVIAASSGGWATSTTYLNGNINGGATVVSRTTVKAGELVGGSNLAIHADVEFSGSFTTKTILIEIVPVGGASGGGKAFIQNLSNSAALSCKIDAVVNLSHDLQSFRSATINMPASGVVDGDSTTSYVKTTYDISGDMDILCTVVAVNDASAILNSFSITQNYVANTSDKSGIVCWGDSITAGTGATGTLVYPYMLSKKILRAHSNQGVGGDTAQQITARFVSAPALWGYTSIFMMGRNNVGSATLASEVLGLIDLCVSKLTHGRFLIGSITPSDTEIIGTASRNQIIAANAAIASKYPNNYVDILGGLATNAGEIPAASRADAVHFTAAGQLIIAHTFATAITLRGF